ncbi:hypothetical protein DFJ63DRAFT_312302 [Scheffersomyces coipomensis]|uniref:uncharacterized protein n=1 Tax=Scheffersomyces coipomensis TaxID=1788519 RepID=UPI00315DC1CC
MYKLSKLVSDSEEYAFCIRNLYDALEKQSIGNKIYITEHDDRSEGFYLSKATISVSNKKTEPKSNYILDSIRSSYRASRRKRCILTAETKEFLQKAFDAQPFPNRKDRELLAKKCGLTNLQVRVWVSNSL